MKSKEELWNICIEIYREMFRKAEPSADFSELVESGEVRQPNFFMRYFLDEREQSKIIERFSKINNLDRFEKQAVLTEVTLGCSPVGIKNNWYEREKHGRTVSA